MIGKALAGRVRRLERRYGIGDLSRLSDDELQRRMDEIDVMFAPTAEAALEPFRQSRDVAGELAELRRIIDDRGW